MDLHAQADALIRKINHFTLTHSGHGSEEATDTEIYISLASALLEEIMINWSATLATFDKKKTRTLYYLSMEYLPGRMTGNNITNLGASDLVKMVLKKMNRSLSNLIRCESDPGLGNGGLGRLASCLLDSLATLQYPARGYGLRYQYGVFEQEIWNGEQIEKPDCWLLNTYPWEVRSDEGAINVFFRGTPVLKKNRHNEDVYLLENYEEVRAMPYDLPIVGFSSQNDFSVISCRLWSTKESPRNFRLQHFNEGFLDQAAENTSLTDVLYPNDKTEMGRRVRIKQEFLLVSATLHDIVQRHMRVHQTIANFRDKVRIQINDTHPALVIAETIRILTKDFDLSWNDAVETTRECCSYTNHTILREALEEWNEHTLQHLLPRQMFIIQKLNQELCDSVRRQFPNDEERVRQMSIIEHGRVRMAHLSIYGCHNVNGVAEIHSEILKSDLFHNFYQMTPKKFVNVTNGVTQRRWLYHANPRLAEWISSLIGRHWISDFKEISRLSDFAKDPNAQQEFLKIKQENKRDLLQFLSRENHLRSEKGVAISNVLDITTNAIFDVHVKRFHEYKRQLMNALNLIMVYHEICDLKTKRTPRLVIFGGKSAAGYVRAKEIIRLISAIQRKINCDPKAKNQLVVSFIENYNVSKAELIIPATDLSEQIPTAGWEASGTGNMKFSMNGALTIGTDDGANVEMRKAVTDRWWPFGFGASAKENATRAHYHSEKILQSDPAIARAMNALIDRSLSTNKAEEEAFREIHRSLIENDRFYVLGDLRSYYETQKRVDALYSNPSAWAETAIHNVASMGRFSSDESIHNYAHRIWGLSPCPPDPEILNYSRKTYFEYAACQIITKT